VSVRVAWLSAIAAALLGLGLGAAILAGQPDRSFAMWPVALWSIAPLAAPFAVRARVRGSARAPGVIALVMGIEATSIVSVGGGFLYALFVAPVLLLAFVTASAIRSDAG
jgi:hypothetical protein